MLYIILHRVEFICIISQRDGFWDVLNFRGPQLRVAESVQMTKRRHIKKFLKSLESRLHM